MQPHRTHSPLPEPRRIAFAVAHIFRLRKYDKILYKGKFPPLKERAYRLNPTSDIDAKKWPTIFTDISHNS